LRGHGRAVQSASFSTDGARIVSSATDETVRLWDVPYLQMSRDELLLSACQGRLRGARKLSREEMRHIGEPDSAPEIDACADVTEGPEGPEGALQKELGPLFSAPTPADMIASVAPIRRLDVLLEPVWNTPEQRVPTNLLYNLCNRSRPKTPLRNRSYRLAKASRMRWIKWWMLIWRDNGHIAIPGKASRLLLPQ